MWWRGGVSCICGGVASPASVVCGAVASPASVVCGAVASPSSVAGSAFCVARFVALDLFDSDESDDYLLLYVIGIILHLQCRKFGHDQHLFSLFL